MGICIQHSYIGIRHHDIFKDAIVVFIAKFIWIYLSYKININFNFTAGCFNLMPMSIHRSDNCLYKDDHIVHDKLNIIPTAFS